MTDVAIPGVTHIDVGAVREAGDGLSADAEEQRRVAVLVGDLAGVPHDPFGLARVFAEYERARSAFDQRVAERIDGAGEKAVSQVLDACGADTNLP